MVLEYISGIKNIVEDDMPHTVEIYLHCPLDSCSHLQVQSYIRSIDCMHTGLGTIDHASISHEDQVTNYSVNHIYSQDCIFSLVSNYLTLCVSLAVRKT